MAQLIGTNSTAIVIPIRQSPVRTAVRFPISLALTIQTVSGSFEGVTENISANGLLLVCTHLPEFEGAIEFSMAMPSAILGTETDICIDCLGRIVWRAQEVNQVKAGIVIDEYFLRV